jgi:hypothetical protein
MLNHREQTEIERYMQAGGGILLIQSDLEPAYQWPWYDERRLAFSTWQEVLVRKVSSEDERQHMNFDG